MARIFVVEDDASVRELIVCTLDSGGFEVTAFESGEDFLSDAAKLELPQLVLMDIMLPGIDGYETFQMYKQRLADAVPPVIFLTARSTEVDKVKGLNVGADDYVTKPFGVLELIARVNAVLRRAAKPATTAEEQEIMTGGDIRLYPSAHRVFVGEEKVTLTLKEFDLLRYFMKNHGLVLTRDMLLCEIWGIDTEIETRTVDMHVKTLRQKLGSAAEYIKTVRGVGYRFEP